MCYRQILPIGVHDRELWLAIRDVLSLHDLETPHGPLLPVARLLVLNAFEEMVRQALAWAFSTGSR
jgi:hypothetical protein